MTTRGPHGKEHPKKDTAHLEAFPWLFQASAWLNLCESPFEKGKYPPPPQQKNGRSLFGVPFHSNKQKGCQKRHHPFGRAFFRAPQQIKLPVSLSSQPTKCSFLKQKPTNKKENQQTQPQPCHNGPIWGRFSLSSPRLFFFASAPPLSKRRRFTPRVRWAWPWGAWTLWRGRSAPPRSGSACGRRFARGVRGAGGGNGKKPAASAGLLKR